MEDTHRQMNDTSAILPIVEQFHEEEEYWDVQVQVDSELFKCQRSILAKNSEYFDALFRSGYFRKDGTIILPEKDATAFEIILHFMYTGEICMTDSDALSVLVLSDFLGLRTDYFKELMLELLRDRSQETGPMQCALDLLSYAYKNEINVLVDNMSAHVCRHLYHFSEHPQLMQISFEHLNALLERSQNHIVPLRGSADVLVKIVQNWVNCNRKTRSQYRCQLMENVDLANLSTDFTRSLMNKLENSLDEVLNLSEEVRSLSELETLGVALEVVPFGKAGLWGTLSLNVPHASNQPGSNVVSFFSPSRMISNLSWRICLERCSSGDVYVYLCCEGTNLASEWNCHAHAFFFVKSNKEGRDDLVRVIRFGLFRSCDPAPRGWGLKSFLLPWNELVDPEKGYIADDDSITLNAHVHADVPFLSYKPQ